MENFRTEGYSGINEKSKNEIIPEGKTLENTSLGRNWLEWSDDGKEKISAFISIICLGLQLKFRDNENRFKAHLFQWKGFYSSHIF